MPASASTNSGGSAGGDVTKPLERSWIPVVRAGKMTLLAGTAVGAVHAGWRGLADGVIESTVAAMKVAPSNLMAWLGPAIGPQAFETGDDVRNAFMQHDPAASAAFTPSPAGEGRGEGKKYLADIYLLAHQRLNKLGITQIYGGGLCTYTDQERFFSFRRDGATGRMATLIWLT